MTKEIYNFDGYAGATIRVDVGDDVGNLVDDGLLITHATTGEMCRVVIITCHNSDLVFAFGGSVPDQDGIMGHVLTVGSVLRVVNTQSIKSLRYISATDGMTARLMITPEYFQP